MYVSNLSPYWKAEFCYNLETTLVLRQSFQVLVLVSASFDITAEKFIDGLQRFHVTNNGMPTKPTNNWQYISHVIT